MRSTKENSPVPAQGQPRSSCGAAEPPLDGDKNPADHSSVTGVPDRPRKLSSSKEGRAATPSSGSRSRARRLGTSVTATPGGERRPESQHQLRHRLSLVERHLELDRVHAELCPAACNGSSPSRAAREAQASSPAEQGLGEASCTAQKDSGDLLRTPRPSSGRLERHSWTPCPGRLSAAQGAASADGASRGPSRSPGAAEQRLHAQNAEELTEAEFDAFARRAASQPRHSQQACASARPEGARPGAKPIAGGGESSPRGHLRSSALVDVVGALCSTVASGSSRCRCSRSPVPRSIVRHSSVGGSSPRPVPQSVQLLDEAERVVRVLQERTNRVRGTSPVPVLGATVSGTPTPCRTRVVAQASEMWASNPAKVAGTSESGIRSGEPPLPSTLVNGASNAGHISSVVRHFSGAIPSAACLLTAMGTPWQHAAGGAEASAATLPARAPVPVVTTTRSWHVAAGVSCGPMTPLVLQPGSALIAVTGMAATSPRR